MVDTTRNRHATTHPPVVLLIQRTSSAYEETRNQKPTPITRQTQTGTVASKTGKKTENGKEMDTNDNDDSVSTSTSNE